MSTQPGQRDAGSHPDERTYRFEWIADVDAPKYGEREFKSTDELLEYLNELRMHMWKHGLPKNSCHDGLPIGRAKVIIFDGEDAVGEVDASEVRTDLRDGRDIRDQSVHPPGEL